MSMHLLGSSAPAAYLGGKRTWAPAIVALLGLERPQELHLVEPGPWGRVWQALSNRTDATVALLCLERWVGRDSKELWVELAEAPVPKDAGVFAATFLHLQTCSFGGKPVRVDGDRWKTPGFANLAVSARERGFVERTPVRLTLPRVERAVAALQALPVRVDVLRAQELLPSEARGSVVLLDPPYAGREGYADSFVREDVVQVAQGWAEAGAVVAVCEAEPVGELLEAGWQARKLWRTNRQPRTAMGAPVEWITANRLTAARPVQQMHAW